MDVDIFLAPFYNLVFLHQSSDQFSRYLTSIPVVNTRFGWYLLLAWTLVIF